MNNDLIQRLFNFAVDVLNLLKVLLNSPELNVIRYQLAKSATSAGANYEESQAGSSKADFKNKVRIALKEMRESNYWLRILDKINSNEPLDKELKILVQESLELKKILESIVSKVSK